MASPSIMLQRALIRFNNRVTRWRRVRVPPARLLLLAAHCLQGSACGLPVSRDVDRCKGCGLCPVKGLLDLRNRYGVQCRIAAGGRQALGFVKDPGIDAVVAVACERELVEGIVGSFPKPVLAVSNSQPKGACHDTQANLAEVEKAIREMLA
jgi:hypothetical protein